MSFISDIFAGGAEGVLKGVRDVVSSFKADPLEMAKIESVLTKAEMDLTLGLSQAQTRINEVEAASQDKFVSRWRPAAGWVGVSALAYAAFVYPLATWASQNFGWMPPPEIHSAILMDIVSGMLGLGAMRSWEKKNK